MAEIIIALMVLVAVTVKLIILVRCRRIRYYCNNDECHRKCYCWKYRSELGYLSLLLHDMKNELKGRQH